VKRSKEAVKVPRGVAAQKVTAIAACFSSLHLLATIFVCCWATLMKTTGKRIYESALPNLCQLTTQPSHNLMPSFVLMLCSLVQMM
jgi:hypothetical protein